MFRRLVALVTTGLLACTASAPPPPAAEEKHAAPAPSEGCREKVAEMRALFSQVSGEPNVINPIEGMQLPESSQGAAIEDGFPLFVLADGSYQFDGAAKPSVDALKEQLTEEFDKGNLLAERMDKPFSPHILLVADVRAPAAAVLALGPIVPPGTKYTLIAILAGDIVPPHPPYPPALVDVLKNSPAEQRAIDLARLLETAIGSCEPIKQVFQDVATAPSDKRTATLVSGLPDAVEKCRCEGIDLEMLFGAVWATGGKTEKSMRALALALSFDAGTEEVTLPAAATVTDLVRLAEQRGASPFRLVLRN